MKAAIIQALYAAAISFLIVLSWLLVVMWKAGAL